MTLPKRNAERLPDMIRQEYSNPEPTDAELDEMSELDLSKMTAKELGRIVMPDGVECSAREEAAMAEIFKRLETAEVVMELNRKRAMSDQRSKPCVHDMNMHDCITLDCMQANVLRVPGGWIYTTFCDITRALPDGDTYTEYRPSSVFVPHTPEETQTDD